MGNSSVLVMAFFIPNLSWFSQSQLIVRLVYLKVKNVPGQESIYAGLSGVSVVKLSGVVIFISD